MQKQNTININRVYPICEHSLYFDGCSKGNPGPAGIGAVICKNDNEISQCSENIGIKTNNESEYCALIIGLETAVKLNIKALCVYGDSLLVINQVNNIWNVKNEKLFKLYEKVVVLKGLFNYIIFTHVYRSNNKRADQLANFGLTKNIHNNDELYDEKEDDYIQVLDIDWKEETSVNKFNNIKKVKINPFFPSIKK